MARLRLGGPGDRGRPAKPGSARRDAAASLRWAEGAREFTASLASRTAAMGGARRGGSSSTPETGNRRSASGSGASFASEDAAPPAAELARPDAEAARDGVFHVIPALHAPAGTKASDPALVPAAAGDLAAVAERVLTSLHATERGDTPAVQLALAQRGERPPLEVRVTTDAWGALSIRVRAPEGNDAAAARFAGRLEAALAARGYEDAAIEAS